MSAVQEPNIDLVAVACVVDSSLLLASEWSRILIEYVYPLLKRLNELHPSHQFRLAFVTYGAADTRPTPVIQKSFFAPLSQVSKVLREEPSKLGIGQTNLGSGRGLSALEGLIAAIEIFDILMTSTNSAVGHAQTQSPQKESRSLVSHLLHIAASPPDNAQRPHWNTLQHLDSVNWDSIPTELKKRKINLSLISLRKIPQFQELQSSVAGSGIQSPWFNVRAPHILSLAGFPVPKTNTKRQTDALPSDQSPDSKRQKVVADTISKPSPASPSLSPARPPQNRSQQPIPSQISQPTSSTVSGQNSSPAQPMQPTPTMPSSTPTVSASATPLPPSVPPMPHVNPQTLDQVVKAHGVKIRQMMERLKMLDKELAEIDSQMSSTSQAAILDGLQKDRDYKVQFKERITALLKLHCQKMRPAKEFMAAQVGAAGSAPQNSSAEADPSSQSYPPNGPGTSSERPAGPTTDEQKPPTTEMTALNFQSRGSMAPASNDSNPQASSSQNQSHPNITPEVMQKLTERRGIPPPSFGPSPAGMNPHETGGASNVTNAQHQAPNKSAWHGTFSVVSSDFGGQGASEIQIHVVGMFDRPIPVDSWPKNFALKACKEPLRDYQELITWLKKQQAHTPKMQFIPSSLVPDESVNKQRFQALQKFMTDRHIFAYTGPSIPSGKFIYMIVFPLQSYFVGVIFPDGPPDLPGSGNVLDGGPPAPEVTKPPPINFPPEFLAHLRNLEPAQRKQAIAQAMQAVRMQHQLRLQKLQQEQQQSLAGSSQATSSHGMPTPYQAMSLNLPTNINVPMNAGAFSAGGRTVNYEMLQSFMQRSADGSTSQGMNPS